MITVTEATRIGQNVVAYATGRELPADKLARLTALKTVWDPTNVFHLNNNIRPGVK